MKEEDKTTEAVRKRYDRIAPVNDLMEGLVETRRQVKILNR